MIRPLICGILLGISASGCHVHRSESRLIVGSACAKSNYLLENAMLTAQDLIEDRFGENRLKLPWTSQSPPRYETSPKICAAAGKLYSSVDGLSEPTDEAVVVAVGGLYVIHGSPTIFSGEFGITLVTDRKFRILQRHLGW